MESFRSHVLLGCVLLLLAGGQASNYEDAAVVINSELDFALDYVRTSGLLHKLLDNISFPIEIAEDGLHVSNIRLTNLTNLYRSGDASVGFINKSLEVNVALEVEELSMDGDWWMKILFSNYSGQIGLHFESLTIHTIVTIHSLKVDMPEFSVPSIGNIQLTNLTGANSFIRTIAQDMVNSSAVKRDIAAKIEQKARDLFNSIFGDFDRIKDLLQEVARPITEKFTVYNSSN